MAIACLALALSSGGARASEPDPSRWPAVLAEAKGQKVAWYAWGGEPRINDYIGWVAGTVRQRYGVELRQVRVADTAEVVNRLLAERSAGRTSGGAVDLVWLNGENFAALKTAGLLFGPFAQDLPNFALADTESKPVLTTDFTLPTQGYESPWGTAQLTFMHDAARLASPPRTLAALLAWARSNPGRFTYPQPPDFLGTTFLKQMLVSLALNRSALARPVDDKDFEAAVGPLFAYLDALHPLLWRAGRAFPQNAAALRVLLADGETDIAFTFNPGEASAAIEKGELPATVRSFTLEGGTIANAHFVAIPANSSAKAGALVVANFLLSPEAQARKSDPRIWGDPTVLSLAKLAPQDRDLFARLPAGKATLLPDEMGPALPEPDSSWVARLETEWARRYGVAP
jgi:putative thiamine transport system substrate-binding protein